MNDRSRDTTTSSKPSPRRGSLGRGLEALIPSLEAQAPAASISSIKISSISPNPRQPRSIIDPDELDVLAASIRTHGVIQPIVIRPTGTPDTYTAKESGGGNINCARYFYFLVTIDSSQAFGYPEDVARVEDRHERAWEKPFMIAMGLPLAVDEATADNLGDERLDGGRAELLRGIELRDRLVPL